MKKSILYTLILSVALMVVCGIAVADEAKLVASDGAADDRFGIDVSVSGDVAIVGTPGDDDNGINSGSAYIYRWNGSIWVEEQKLTATDGEAYDNFGGDVSVCGDVAIVGATAYFNNLHDFGSAYIYRWNGSVWVEEQQLTASDGASKATFGSAVSVDCDVVIVGAQYDDATGTDSGSAYIYRWNGATWVEAQKLTASDGTADYVFGETVSVSGNVIIVGAAGNDDYGHSSGAAYIYRWNGSIWVEEQKLTASDGAADDEFGGTASVCGDVAIVGAHAYFNDLDNSGAAYIYRWNGSTWVEEQKLTVPDGAADDEFGGAVSVNSDMAIVGTHTYYNNPDDVGSAYIYRWNGSIWVEEQRLTAPDGAAGDWFGGSVSVSGDVAIVGTPGDNENGINSGAVYIYKCSYDINPNEEDYESAGGSSSVTVTADAECNWQAASTVDWISITAGSSGSGNGTVEYSVAANSSTDSRTGTMIIAGKTFTVTQGGVSCIYAIDSDSETYDATGGTAGVVVTVPDGCDWQAASTVDWIGITAGSSGSGNGTVEYSVAANLSTDSRTGTMIIAGKTFTVTQGGTAEGSGGDGGGGCFMTTLEN